MNLKKLSKKELRILHGEVCNELDVRSGYLNRFIPNLHDKKQRCYRCKYNKDCSCSFFKPIKKEGD